MPWDAAAAHAVKTVCWTSDVALLRMTHFQASKAWFKSLYLLCTNLSSSFLFDEIVPHTQRL